MEDAFWNFVDQKWRDSLNVAAVEPASWDQGADYRQGLDGPKRGEGEKLTAKKTPSAGVHAAVVSKDVSKDGVALTGSPGNASLLN